MGVVSNQFAIVYTWGNMGHKYNKMPCYFQIYNIISIRLFLSSSQLRAVPFNLWLYKIEVMPWIH